MKKAVGLIFVAIMLISSNANASWFSFGSDDDKQSNQERRSPVLNKTVIVTPALPLQPYQMPPQQQPMPTYTPPMPTSNYAPLQTDSFVQMPPPPAVNMVDTQGYPLLGATPPPMPAPQSVDQDQRAIELRNDFEQSQNIRQPLLQQNPYQFGGNPITINSGAMPSMQAPEVISQQPKPKPEYAAPVFPQNSKSITVKSARKGGGYVVNQQPLQQNVIEGGTGFVFDENAARLQGNLANMQEYKANSQANQFIAPTQFTAVSAAPKAQVYKQPIAPMANNNLRSYAPPPAMPNINKNIDVADSYRPMPSTFDSPIYAEQKSALPQAANYGQHSGVLRPSRYEQQRRFGRKSY